MTEERKRWKLVSYTFAGETLFDSESEAQSERAHLESLQPENHYEIVRVGEDEAVNEEEA